MMQSGQLPNVHFREALLWLGDHERKQAEASALAEAHRTRIEAAANKRDNIAAAAAIIAAIAAVVGAVISFLALMYSLHPA